MHCRAVTIAGLFAVGCLSTARAQTVPSATATVPPATATAATRSVFQTRPTTARASAASWHVYLGNLHAHTAASDGTGTAAEAFAYARETGRLDFIAVTDHNHLLGGEKATPAKRTALYADIKKAADDATRPGTFVGLYGQEYSSMSKGNHVNAFDVPAVIDVPNGQFAGLLDWLDRHRDSTGAVAVVQFNHPALGFFPGRSTKLEFGRDDFGDDAGWVRQMGRVTSLVELLNGEPLKDDPPGRAPQSMELHYRRLLRLGFRLAPTGNQDNHKKQWGTITEARTGVIASELTKPALLAAMRARHVYASEDRNLRVIVAVNDGLFGDEVNTPGPLRVAVRFDDADEAAVRYTVEAVQGQVGGTDETITTVATIDGNTPAGEWVAIDGVSLTTPGEFVYFRITQNGAQGVDRLWTAPVWLVPQ